jgi:hypothetical protein
MMRSLRLTVCKLFVAVLLTLCVGVQVLEATGRWDRTLQDAGDEAVIVTIVLCIGAAIALAGLMRTHVSLSAVRSLFVFVRTARRPPLSLSLPSSLCAHPPLSLRI